MAQEKRYRVRYEFQLDHNKPEQEEIADIIEQLKNERAYAPAIRDGLRLIWELREGNLDTFRQLFPDAYHELTMAALRNVGLSVTTDRTEQFQRKQPVKPEQPPKILAQPVSTPSPDQKKKNTQLLKGLASF